MLVEEIRRRNKVTDLVRQIFRHTAIFFAGTMADIMYAIKFLSGDHVPEYVVLVGTHKPIQRSIHGCGKLLYNLYIIFYILQTLLSMMKSISRMQETILTY